MDETFVSMPEPEDTATVQPPVEQEPIAQEPIMDVPVIPTEPVEQPAPEKKKKKGWTAGKVIALALSCALLGSIAGAAAALLKSPSSPITGILGGSQSGTTNIYEGDRETTKLEIHKIDTSKLMTAAEVYAANVNSTVGITTSITTNYWGHITTSAASGSGFIMSEDGYILTNYHVIEDSTSITVRLYNNDSFEAKLIGYDESNDIAVLKIEATGLVPVILGDSDKLNVGDDVVAIGNPLGELTFSLTKGAVSALNREVTMENGITMNLIQTDCAINSGNSGGALFNMYGEVVGITNAKYSSGSGETSIDNIGFAIPLNDVRKIVQSILEKGYISKPYLGVNVTDVSADTQSYGLPAGAAIKQIQTDSPAEKAGLQLNDIITDVNGTAITSASELVAFIADCNVGDKLTITVYRHGTTLTVEATLEEMVQSATENETTQQQQPQLPNDFEYYIPGWDWDFSIPGFNFGF